MNDWIIGRDPEKSGRYLCYHQYEGETKRDVGIVWYDAADRRWQYSFLGIQVFAWMPLPKAPKIEE